MKRRQRGQAKGEKNTRSRLKNEDILKIRELYKAGNITHKSIAAMFKIHKTHVHRILKNKAWTHVDSLAVKAEPVVAPIMFIA